MVMATKLNVKPRKGEIGITYTKQEDKSAGGIILNSKEEDTYMESSRWLQVWAVGDGVTDIEVGDEVLVTHLKWTEQVMLDDGSQVAFTSWKEVHAVRTPEKE